MFNPFPGLRPFEADEDHLFFGRERDTDDLLRRLRTARFLAVVGTSGSGKSSLVRSGLIPSLYSGFMVAAGSSWRIATIRPGEDPIGNLAAELNKPDVLGGDPELADTNQLLIESTLRRGPLGLVEAVRHARLPAGENLLVIIDQFEELFRYQRSRPGENSRGQAIAFVNLLLEASRQDAQSIYVVLTMRSDFIGDCIEYPGLPEAVNAGQYLVPRLTRDELRSAITGPVAVGGGTIAPRLVLRLLNDLGHDQDQLPVLQHALMRTWDHWAGHAQPGEPIDIADYEAVGTLEHALSMHAEEAYAEAGAGRAALVERIFKALTDTFSDPRGVRRPTSVAELAAICEADETAVIETVDIFRRQGRSFLMPPASTPLSAKSIVDVAHESLMRCWYRLIAWAEEERAAAGFYSRLSQAAAWHAQGTAGLWRDPELALALRWRDENRPTAAWAGRYDENFAQAMTFLAASESERDRITAEIELERKQRLRRTEWAAGVFATLFVAAGVLAYLAWRADQRAQANFTLALGAVEEMLASADLDLGRVGADIPQMQEFRQELLEKAERFYAAFLAQRPDSEELRRQQAFAHFRVGHINRMLGRTDVARREYEDAISQFGELAEANPGEPEYREAMASAYNWLGETLRQSSAEFDVAAKAYDEAVRIQQQLLDSSPGNADYRKSLARARYNRGIHRYDAPVPPGEAVAAAEVEFRAAIELLEPLAVPSTDPTAAQELARVLNNLGVISAGAERRALYERAIAIDEQLLERDPGNREAMVELSEFYKNLAQHLRDEGEIEAARERNRRAVALLAELGRPAPSIAVAQGDAFSVRGMMQPDAPSEALAAYREAFDLFAPLARTGQLQHQPDFHQRFSEFLINLATLTGKSGDAGEARRLLAEAVNAYVALVDRIVTSKSIADANLALDYLADVLPALPEPERQQLTASVDRLTALSKQDAPAVR